MILPHRTDNYNIISNPSRQCVRKFYRTLNRRRYTNNTIIGENKRDLSNNHFGVPFGNFLDTDIFPDLFFPSSEFWHRVRYRLTHLLIGSIILVPPWPPSTIGSGTPRRFCFYPFTEPLYDRFCFRVTFNNFLTKETHLLNVFLDLTG